MCVQTGLGQIPNSKWYNAIDFIILMARLLTVLAVIVFSISIFFHADFFTNSPDTGFYADIARNFVKQGELSSNYFMLSFIKFAPKTIHGKWPPRFPPLYPFTIAISFLIFGVSDLSVALTSGFFFIATVPLLYNFAKTIFDERTARLSTVWYIFCFPLLSYAVIGLSEPLFTFLILSSLILVFVKNPHFFLPGISVGLSYLTKTQGMLLLFPIAIYIFKSKPEKIRNTLSFLAGFLSILVLSKIFLPTPALDHLPVSSHQLWNMLAYDAFVSHQDFTRTLVPVGYNDVLSHTDAIIRKFVLNTHVFLQDILGNPISLMIALFFLHFIKRETKRQIIYLRFLVLALLGIFSIVHIATIFELRYIYPLFPLVYIFAADMFISFVNANRPQRIGSWSFCFTVFFVILPFLVSPGLITYATSSIKNPRKPAIAKIIGTFAKQNTPQSAVIATDSPSALTWYGREELFLSQLNYKILKQ